MSTATFSAPIVELNALAALERRLSGRVFRTRNCDGGLKRPLIPNVFGH